MLNKIWFSLLVIGIVYGFAKGAWQSAYPQPTPPVAAAIDDANTDPPDAFTSSAAPTEAEPATGLIAAGKNLNAAVFEAAKTGAELAIGMIGFMALWLGMLNVAKDAGLVDALARLLSPLMRWLFPEIPNGHPAQGAVLMNLSANMLGLDNAATPLGLKAMQELHDLNSVKDTATDAMAMFLAINTSSIVLVPFTLLSYRVIKHSENPAEPVAAVLLSTLASTAAAIFITRWMSRRRRYRVVAPTERADGNGAAAPGGGNP